MGNRASLIFGALSVLAVLAVGLVLARVRIPAPFPGSRPPRLLVELDPPAENPHPMFLVASLPVPAAPDPRPQSAAADPRPVEATPTPPPPPLPPEVRDELEQEKKGLLAKLEKERGFASSVVEKAARELPPPPPRPSPRTGPGSVGVIRELDLSGYPDEVRTDVMQRYRLRIVRKYVSGKSRQSFLSSAATDGSDRFFATPDHPPGIYEVFELSRESVAAMSRLEESELKRRGLPVDRTRVKRVVFGIVETGGTFDLGVKAFEWEGIP